MKVNNFIDVLGAVVLLAIVTEIVTSKNTSSIVSNSGTAFSNVLKSAMGK